MKDIKPIAKGKKAPAFSTTDQDGKTVSLRDFTGKRVALFFYPKDNTPTCTEEVCNLRDNFAALKRKGIIVLGVSADSEKSHRNFIQKHSLPFPLLADTGMEIIKKYGVWGEKMLFGRKYMGIHRVTYLIGKDGNVEAVIDDVTAKDHAAQILALTGKEKA